MPEAIEQIRQTATPIVPEIVLLAMIYALFLVGPLLVSDSGEPPAGLRHRWGVLSLFALVIAWLLWFKGGTAAANGGMFHIDSLVWYTRGLSLSAGILPLVLWNQIR